MTTLICLARFTKQKPFTSVLKLEIPLVSNGFLEWSTASTSAKSINNVFFLIPCELCIMSLKYSCPGLFSKSFGQNSCSSIDFRHVR